MVINSYSVTSISNNDSSGGLIGWLYQGSSTQGSYYDTDTSGYSNMCGSTLYNGTTCDDSFGQTDAEMKVQENFVGWDFENIWKIDSAVNNGYPYFSWQTFAIPVVEQPVVTSSSSNGSGGSSSPASAPVCGDTKPGSAPRLVSATATGANEITLTWTKASDPVTYYLVAYGTKSGEQLYGNPNIGGSNTTSYTVKGLSGGKKYFFKVRAGNNCMPGDYSNELSATVYGVSYTGSAENFLPGVLGANTDDTNSSLTPSVSITPSTSPTGEVLSDTTEGKDNGTKEKNYDYLWLLLFIPAYFGGRYLFKKK
jgi:hypothetical protein